jgi:hypothetical protein
MANTKITDLTAYAAPLDSDVLVIVDVANDITKKITFDNVQKYYDADASNYVAFAAPSTVSSNVTWTLPGTDGTSGQFLSTNGSGTLTWASASGGLSDGDKGDITVSSSASVWTIDNSVVTYAKIQDVSATDKLLGRSSAGSGVVEEITCTSAGRALLDDADAAAQRATLGLVIGTNVQAYDADTAKLDVVQTFTAVQTLTDPAIIGTIKEDVYTISDGAAFEVDPGNGSVQLITLGANRTPKATNFAAGEAVTLMVDDGTAYTLTWTDATWGTSGVIWTGGSAPTLATSGYTVVQFWKVGSQVYGAHVGDVA